MMLLLSFIFACSSSPFKLYTCEVNSECEEAFGMGMQCGESGYCEPGEVEVIDACDDNSDCRDAFGFGSYCGESGTCESLEPNPRCHTIPERIGLGDTEGYENGIAIGTIANSSRDQPAIIGSVIAMEEISALTENDEHPLFFVTCNILDDFEENIDSLSETDALNSVIDHLESYYQVEGIVGPNRSDLLTQVYAYTSGEKLILSPSADGNFLKEIDGQTSPDNPGAIWQVTPSNRYQIAQLVNRLVQFNKKKVYLLHENSTYGTDFFQIFESFRPENDPDREFELITCQIEAPLSVENNCTHFLEGDGYDTIVVASSNVFHHWELLHYVTNKMTLKPEVQIFFDATGRNQGTIDMLTSDLNGKVWGVSPYLQDDTPLYRQLETKFSAASGEHLFNNPAAIFAHDGIWMMAMAHLHAYINDGLGDSSQLGIGLHHLNGINNTSEDDWVELSATGWVKAKAKFMDGEAIDIRGASGALDYNPDTEQNALNLTHGIMFTTNDGAQAMMTCQGAMTSTCEQAE